MEGRIDLPGQQDRFNLQLVPGRWVLFDSLDDDAESIYVRLVAPSGLVVWETQPGYDGWPFYFLEQGSYELVVFGLGDTIGDYCFRMLDLDQSAEMVPGLPVAGRLDPPIETLAYQFDAVAGQRLAFESLSASHANASWSLVNPSGQDTVSGSISDNLGEVTILVSGTHLVLVRVPPGGNQPLDFAILGRLISGPVGQPSGFGVVRSGTHGGGHDRGAATMSGSLSQSTSMVGGCLQPSRRIPDHVATKLRLRGSIAPPRPDYEPMVPPNKAVNRFV